MRAFLFRVDSCSLNSCRASPRQHSCYITFNVTHLLRSEDVHIPGDGGRGVLRVSRDDHHAHTGVLAQLHGVCDLWPRRVLRNITLPHRTTRRAFRDNKKRTKPHHGTNHAFRKARQGKARHQEGQHHQPVLCLKKHLPCICTHSLASRRATDIKTKLQPF